MYYYLLLNPLAVPLKKLHPMSWFSFYHHYKIFNIIYCVCSSFLIIANFKKSNLEQLS